MVFPRGGSLVTGMHFSDFLEYATGIQGQLVIHFGEFRLLFVKPGNLPLSV